MSYIHCISEYCKHIDSLKVFTNQTWYIKLAIPVGRPIDFEIWESIMHTIGKLYIE